MDNQFNFKYTAPTEEERKEIDSIRRQYAPQDHTETKIERLRRLDNIVKSMPVIYSLVCGVVGALIFGLGLAMVLQWSIWFGGIALMVVGSAPMIIAYPVYVCVLKRYKEKYGEEILKISEELLNQKEN